MLLRFPFPESAEANDMDVSRVQPTSTVKKRKASCGPGLSGRTSWRLALLMSLVFLLRVLSPGALAATRTFGDDNVSGEDVAVAAYESGSVSTPRMQTLRGSVKGGNQQQQLHFGHFLGMFTDGE